ncbi:site-specific integrase [Vreelandella rituensis]|uniref:Site-specific integrase n=1 Tax=Vreelandella rituensis TaxID=2282306 RepID=A0A368UAT7_9GAMM|nr:site-specific integrase [Halomonas rituensis]RCV93756.1 site-specific integrase [Halomonas rituensis]
MSKDKPVKHEGPGTAVQLPPSKPADGRLPAKPSRSFLPDAHLNRDDSIDATKPVVRITNHPIPRLENPAHIHLQSQGSPSGARSKMYLLNNVARYFGAHDYEYVVWHDLKVPAIKFVLGRLRDEGYKPSTRNAYLSALKGTAKESWGMEIMTPDAYERIRAIKPAKNHPEPAGRAQNLSVIKSLVTTARTDGTLTANRNALMILFLGFLGIRREELISIHIPRDFDFAEKKIKIHGKGTKKRNLRLPDPLWEELIQYLDAERGYSPGALFCRYGNNRATPRINDVGLNVTAVNYILNKVRERCNTTIADLIGIEVTPHDMRRSFATTMHEHGMSIRELQVLLGHSNSSTTETYVRDDKEAYLQKAASVGESLFQDK